MTDAEIRQAVEDGADSFRDLRDNLGIATVCGSCACVAKDLIKASAKQPTPARSGAFFSAA